MPFHRSGSVAAMPVKIVNIESKRIGDYDLNPRQATALPLVLSGMSNKDVAAAVQVNVCTISEWINNHVGFKKALAVEKDAALERARRVLESSAVDAAMTLRDTATKGSGSANVTKACQLILDKCGVGSTEEGLVAAGVDSQTAALVALIQTRRAEKELSEATGT